MEPDLRIETDSLGAVDVPGNALYGAQTARAVQNFSISGLRFPRGFLRALGLVKKHAAKTNANLGLLDPHISQVIQQAAQEMIEGALDQHFVVDVFQTGSGTSTNMNANEVLANRAAELLGGRRGDRKVHPNDHVNLGQSSNDVIPSTIHIAALEGIERDLIPSLVELAEILTERSVAFLDTIKVGRTHLQDATPVRLGQEFQGYTAQVRSATHRLQGLRPRLGELALGGTAVGTGLNTHPEFAPRTIRGVAEETGLDLREAANHFEAQAARDACVEASGLLKTTAIALIKIANDIRWLGSGPRCGLGELKLPTLQPGSSIMPGKVNPVMCEVLIQVGAQVIGNDATIAFSNAFGSNFELNVMMPVLAYALLQSISLLANGTRAFTHRCVGGLAAHSDHCAATVQNSLALGTALTPDLGYDTAAKIVAHAWKTGGTLRDAAIALTDLDPARIDDLLDPAKQTGPPSRLSQ